MTTIYLVRHGQSEGNLYRFFDGQYNAPLTALGRKQLAALSRRFQDVDLDAVFSSDQQRAFYTAQAIALPKGLAVRPMKEFREINNGIWEHMMWAEIDRIWPGQEDIYAHHMDQWLMPGAEKPQEVAERYINAMKKLSQRYENQSIAIVGHGDALRVTMGFIRGIPLDKIGQDKEYSTNTAVTKLTYDGREFHVKYVYDYSHLTPDLIPSATKYSSLGLTYQLLSPTMEFAIEGIDASGLDRTNGAWIGGYCQDTPVALIQMLPSRKSEPGRLGYYYIAPSYRGQHIGIQPLGQAVDSYRKCGVASVQIELKTPEMQHFFPKYGFVYVKENIWELPILPIAPLDMF